MKIFPAEIANAIVNAGSYSDEQIAYIAIMVLIGYFASIIMASAGVVAAAMAIKNWLRRDKKILIKE